ncbi:MAG: PLDc N-terminal domain-containing protein [Marmoricola sp.]
MIRFELGFGLIVFCLWVFSLIDVIGSDEGAIRHLPKLWWLLIVLFFPFVGSVAWLVAGRPVGPRRPSQHEREMPQYPEYDRPGRAAATSADSDEDFLRGVRDRAEEQRRRYREERLRREPEERGETDPTA